jgi:dUTP pyrophosphatase
MEEAKPPTYAHPTDTGADIYAAHSVALQPQKLTKVRTGIALEIPEGVDLQIRPRSSMSYKNIHLFNSPSTIDSAFRGEMFLLMLNMNEEIYLVNKGDRIAQLVFTPYYKAEFEVVEELTPSMRNTGGFGSTGV